MSKTFWSMSSACLLFALLLPGTASAQVYNCLNTAEDFAYGYFVGAGDDVSDAVSDYATETDEKGCTKGCKQTGSSCSKSGKAFIKADDAYQKNVGKQAKKLCGSIADKTEKADCKDLVKESTSDWKAEVKLRKQSIQEACKNSDLESACELTCIGGTAPPDCDVIFPQGPA